MCVEGKLRRLCHGAGLSVVPGARRRLIIKQQMKTYKWDPEDYRDNSTAQQEWARELIAKLRLKGNETVLDIGSGDGTITAEIAKKVPDGSVIGVDNSRGMIDLANKMFPHRTYRNVLFELCDARKLHFDNQFDVVFSNATLHWVKNHIPVLKGIKKALRQKGRVLLQMGGKGNVKGILRAIHSIKKKSEWREYFVNFKLPYGFYGPDKYKMWLDSIGLEISYLKLIDKDMVHEGKEGLKGFIRTTWLPYTNRVPEEIRNSFIDEVTDKYVEENSLDERGCTHVKMVRLEVMAKKG